MKPYIILGGSGHIGQSIIESLVGKSIPVMAVTSDPQHCSVIEALGAKPVVADIQDMEKLHAIFKTGSRLFLLNPPASPASDTVKEETKNVNAILKALEGSALEWIVAESTYGATAGKQIGDLGVLFEMEESLKQQILPFTIIRGAYYYSNWDALLETAKKGELISVYPADFKLPMVAPKDIGQYAAALLSGPIVPNVIHSIEGPERYSPADVAAAFSQALGRPVNAVSIPRNKWLAFFHKAGYSGKSASYMMDMTVITLDNEGLVPDVVKKGKISISEYIVNLVAKLA